MAVVQALLIRPSIIRSFRWLEGKMWPLKRIRLVKRAEVIIWDQKQTATSLQSENPPTPNHSTSYCHSRTLMKTLSLIISNWINKCWWGNPTLKGSSEITWVAKVKTKYHFCRVKIHRVSLHKSKKYRLKPNSAFKKQTTILKISCLKARINCRISNTFIERRTTKVTSPAERKTS